MMPRFFVDSIQQMVLVMICHPGQVMMIEIELVIDQNEIFSHLNQVEYLHYVNVCLMILVLGYSISWSTNWFSLPAN